MKDSFGSAGKHGYYQPLATRAASLLCLLAITLSLIALTEYALHIIPNHAGVGKLSSVVNTLDKLDGRAIVGWQDASIFESISSSSTIEIHSVTATATGGGLQLGGINSSPTGQPQGGGLIPGSGSTPTEPSAPDISPTPPPVGNDPIVSPSLPTSSPPPDNIGGSAAPSVTSLPNISTVFTATGGGLDLGGSPISNGLTSVATTPVLPQTASVTTLGEPSSGYLSTVAPGEPYSGYLSTATVHSGQSSVRINSGSSTSSDTKPTATIVLTNGTFYSWPDGTMTQAPQINLQQYAAVAFVPLILSVIYTLPWRILDNAIRAMEPFYQLHYAGGALAESSLCLDYSTSILAVMPFKSMRKGHMYVFWSSLASVAVLILTPLSSEVFFVSLSGECHANAPRGSCHAAWGVYTKLARVTQGILAFIAVLVTLILIFGFNRKSGVYSEPLSIAGLAVLFHKSPLVRGFREIDSHVSNNDLKRILKGKRYGTAPFTSTDSTQCYGILPVDADSEAGFVSQPQETGIKGQYSLVETSEFTQYPARSDLHGTGEVKSKYTTWETIKEKLYLLSALLLLAGIFILVVYYHWTSGETGFEHFMDSEGFGVRFMLAGLGVAIKLFWSNIDENLRRLEPYRQLLRGGARPEESILVPVWMSPISAIFPSLRRSNFLVALVAFVTVLSEFLPIALANSTFSAANTHEALVICSNISIGIVSLMIVTDLILIFRPRHHTGRLPREPANIASVLLYITNSDDRGPSMLDSFQGLAMVDKRERNEYIRHLRARYTLGLVAGNQLRIDEDRNVHRLWTD